jgi:hypothetical protein
MTDPTRAPQPGDVFQVHYEMRELGGTLIARHVFYWLVTAVNHLGQLHVLMDDGSQKLVWRDDWQWGLRTGSWKLASPVCSSGAV